MGSLSSGAAGCDRCTAGIALRPAGNSPSGMALDAHLSTLHNYFPDVCPVLILSYFFTKWKGKPGGYFGNFPVCTFKKTGFIIENYLKNDVRNDTDEEDTYEQRKRKGSDIGIAVWADPGLCPPHASGAFISAVLQHGGLPWWWASAWGSRPWRPWAPPAPSIS